MTPRPPRTRAWRTSAALAACLIGLVACSGQAPTSTQAPTTPPIVATPLPTATRKPTASPRTPAPAELQGRWRTVINDADQPVLTLSDFKYTIERLGIGTGAIEVNGDQIRFFGSNLCSGDGLYRWSIDNGTLTLMSVHADPCANRADAIRNRPFTRME